MYFNASYSLFVISVRCNAFFFQFHFLPVTSHVTRFMEIVIILQHSELVTCLTLLAATLPHTPRNIIDNCLIRTESHTKSLFYLSIYLFYHIGNASLLRNKEAKYHSVVCSSILGIKGNLRTSRKKYNV